MEHDEFTTDKPPVNSPLKSGYSLTRFRRPHRTTKVLPLTRAAIDGRSRAAKTFDAIVDGITADLGGNEEQLSTVMKWLREAFAGAAVQVDSLNTRLLAGEKVDVLEHSTAISTLVRVASRIGLQRVARDVTTLGDLLSADYAEQQRQHSEAVEYHSEAIE
jgi:hypothetical protein